MDNDDEGGDPSVPTNEGLAPDMKVATNQEGGVGGGEGEVKRDDRKNDVEV